MCALDAAFTHWHLKRTCSGVRFLLTGFSFTLDKQDKKNYIWGMADKIQFPKREVKVSTTVRLPPSLRKAAEVMAKKAGVSLAVVVETGLRLVLDNEKHDKA